MTDLAQLVLCDVKSTLLLTSLHTEVQSKPEDTDYNHVC